MSGLIRTELLKLRTTRTFIVAAFAVPALSALMATAVLLGSGRQCNPPLGPAASCRRSVPRPGWPRWWPCCSGWWPRPASIGTGPSPRRSWPAPAGATWCSPSWGRRCWRGGPWAAWPWSRRPPWPTLWLERGGIGFDAGTEAMQLAGGLLTATALYFALGVSLGLLVRNQAAAGALALTWLLAIEGLLADVFVRSAFVSWLPAAAGRALVHIGPVTDGPTPPVSAAAFAAYVAIFAVAATALTLHRDIT